MTAKNAFHRDINIPYLELRKTDNSSNPYSTHSHKTLSVGAVTKGATVMTTYGREYEIPDGSLAVLNPGQPHSCNPKAANSRSYWMMYVDVDWCLKLQEQLFGKREEFVPVSRSVIADGVLYNSFIDLCNILYKSENSLEKEEAVLLFISELFIGYCDAKCVAAHSNSIVVRGIEEYLRNGLAANISLKELETKFRMNRYHMLRSFKLETGLPPHAYQLNLRIEKAKDLLCKGWSPAEAAVETGFVDQSHMHRIFRKIVSATPGQYQKNS